MDLVTEEQFGEFGKSLVNTQRLASSHVELYLKDVRAFFFWLVDIEHMQSLEKLPKEVANRYRMYLRTKQLAPATIERQIVKVKVFFDWAIQTKLIKKHPFGKDAKSERLLGSLVAEDDSEISTKKPTRSSSFVISKTGVMMVVVLIGFGAALWTFQPWDLFEGFISDDSTREHVTLEVEPRKIVVAKDTGKLPRVVRSASFSGEVAAMPLPDVPEKMIYDFGYLLHKFALESTVEEVTLHEKADLSGDEVIAEVYLGEALRKKSWLDRLGEWLFESHMQLVDKTVESEERDMEVVTKNMMLSLPLDFYPQEYWEVPDEYLREDFENMQSRMALFLMAEKEKVTFETDLHGVAWGFVSANEVYKVAVEPVVGMRLRVSQKYIGSDEVTGVDVLVVGAERVPDLATGDEQVLVIEGDYAAVETLRQRLPDELRIAMEEYVEQYETSLGAVISPVVVVVYEDSDADGVFDVDEDGLSLEGMDIVLRRVHEKKERVIEKQ